MNAKQTFSEFLVAQKLLTPDQVVDALVNQMNSTPTVCAIVKAKNLLPSESILKVLSLQMERGFDFNFVQSCKSLGFWTREIEEEVHAEIEKSRVPTPELLIRNSPLKMAEMVLALDAYLSEVRVSKAPESREVSLPPVAESAIEQPAESRNDNLSDFFSETLVLKLKNSILALRVSDAASVSAVSEILRALAGAARLAEASALEALFNAAKEQLSLFELPDLDVKTANAVRVDLSEMASRAWSIREARLQEVNQKGDR